MNVSRREFLGALAATTAVGAEGNALPTRVLGKTGQKVSILAFGCGSRFLMYKDEDASVEALNRALDLGITYVDTAYGYGRGVSEQRVGKVMKTRRQGIFLATKVQDRKGDDAMRTFEGSLKRLQVDHVDLLHIHSLNDMEDLAAIEAPDGVLKTLYKIRDQKMARFIGITCHSDPVALKTALERHDFNVTQMALNAALIGMANGARGMSPNPLGGPASFESVALPVANRKKMGVIGMKIFAQEKIVGQAPAQQLLRYVLSLPVTAAVVGMPKLEFLDENIQTARTFTPMPKSEMQKLAGELADRNKVALDRYFSGHVDA
ncbi:MAG TPA: aldo/keto reductase [Bryobacteraceae bacterium]|nr:aldo/keto reductase [Bryobacteraceae bacterium]